ncbi:hypothetical protein WN943_011111 [Citrus x changshan-huyou]
MVGGRDGEPFLESIAGWTANYCASAITNDHSSFRVPVGGVSIKYFKKFLSVGDGLPIFSFLLSLEFSLRGLENCRG